MPKGVYKRPEGFKPKSAFTREKCLGELSNNWKGGVSKDKEYVRNLNRNARRRLRDKTIDILGGKCVRCGFSDKRALQIDHINGGGSKERKERTYKKQFHQVVIDSFIANEGKYQLLCANCNWIKRFEKNEHRIAGIY